MKQQGCTFPSLSAGAAARILPWLGSWGLRCAACCPACRCPKACPGVVAEREGAGSQMLSGPRVGLLRRESRVVAGDDDRQEECETRGVA